MADYSRLPQETINADPWMKANMLGQVAHCSIAQTQTTDLEIGIEHQGNYPCLLAISCFCSVPFMAELDINASFSTSGEAYEHLINRYAQRSVLGESASKYVKGDLRFWRAPGSISRTYSTKWFGGADQTLKVFGPDSIASQFIIVDPSEDLAFSVLRQDGEETSINYGMYFTWTCLDSNTIELGSPV